MHILQQGAVTCLRDNLNDACLEGWEKGNNQNNNDKSWVE